MLPRRFVEEHISEWKEKLGRGQYSGRKVWPDYLYHHAPIENAVEIISRGSFYVEIIQTMFERGT